MDAHGRVATVSSAYPFKFDEPRNSTVLDTDWPWRKREKRAGGHDCQSLGGPVRACAMPYAPNNYQGSKCVSAKLFQNS